MPQIERTRQTRHPAHDQIFRDVWVARRDCPHRWPLDYRKGIRIGEPDGIGFRESIESNDVTYQDEGIVQTMKTMSTFDRIHEGEATTYNQVCDV